MNIELDTNIIILTLSAAALILFQIIGYSRLAVINKGHMSYIASEKQLLNKTISTQNNEIHTVKNKITELELEIIKLNNLITESYASKNLVDAKFAFLDKYIENQEVKLLESTKQTLTDIRDEALKDIRLELTPAIHSINHVESSVEQIKARLDHNDFQRLSASLKETYNTSRVIE